MAIVPITFAGENNFKANLYALEVGSRFADQTNKSGYYDYGQKLAATVSGSDVTIGTGALLVNGRMIEVTSGVTISAAAVTSKALIVAQITTAPVAVNFVLKTGTSYEVIEAALTRQDTNAADSDTVGYVYEEPVYKLCKNFVDEIVIDGSILLQKCEQIALFSERQSNFEQRLSAAETTIGNAVTEANAASAVASGMGARVEVLEAETLTYGDEWTALPSNHIIEADPGLYMFEMNVAYDRIGGNVFKSRVVTMIELQSGASSSGRSNSFVVYDGDGDNAVAWIDVSANPYGTYYVVGAVGIKIGSGEKEQFELGTTTTITNIRYKRIDREAAEAAQ